MTEKIMEGDGHSTRRVVLVVVIIVAIAVVSAVLALGACTPGEPSSKEPKRRSSAADNAKGNQQAAISWRNRSTDWAAVKNGPSETPSLKERETLEKARQSLAGAPGDVPVLMLPGRGGFNVAGAVALRTGYSLTQRRSGVVYTIDASNSQLSNNGKVASNEGLTIDDMEGDRAVAFGKFGIDYRITFSCEEPARRPECLSDKGAANLAQSLVALNFRWK